MSQWDVFYNTLTLMWQGMLGIFVVILIIYIMIKTLLKVFPTKK
ncbi:OadG-related small transporter subunit [Desnuesiella massiliensis]|nr:OadG-related small transporter subunit [Desnuesiella massiliensis]